MSEKLNSKKINITIREDLLDEADTFADANGMSRSGLIQMALRQYLTAVEAAPQIKRMFSAMSDVLEGTINGEIEPHEAQSKVNGIQTA